MQCGKSYTINIKPSKMHYHPLRTKASPFSTWGNHKIGGPGEASLQQTFQFLTQLFHCTILVWELLQRIVHNSLQTVLRRFRLQGQNEITAAFIKRLPDTLNYSSHVQNHRLLEGHQSSEYFHSESNCMFLQSESGDKVTTFKPT